MSLLFRSRTPRNPHRKSAARALRKRPVATFDLESGLVPALLPGAARAPVRHTPRRQRHHAIGYATHRSRQPMFRVT